MVGRSNLSPKTDGVSLLPTKSLEMATQNANATNVLESTVAKKPFLRNDLQEQLP
jgi:hypothetical protein